MKHLAAALTLCVVFVAGCSNRDERLFQRAEAYFAQGQYVLAAEEYRRLVMEESESELAPNALYKLAFIFREELDQPEKAVETYRLVAQHYPDSPYAPDALLWIIHVQSRDLRDAEGVRETLGQIREKFGDRTRLGAQAHLQLVRLLRSTGENEQADHEAQELLRLYPNETRQAAAALLVRAQIIAENAETPDEAIKLYEEIINTYPETPGAIAAKQAIGWMYYGRQKEELAEAHLSKQRAARVIGNVPPFDRGISRQARPLACLRSLMVFRGVAVETAELMAVSGLAFQLHFDAANPAAEPIRLPRNALSRVAEEYGFSTNVWSAPAADASFIGLAQAVGQGRPVMVPQRSGDGEWMIVTGFRPAEEQVHVLEPGSTGYRTMSRDQFIARWAAAAGGHTAAATGPYFQFSLGERQQPTGRPQVARKAAQQAVQLIAGEGQGGETAAAYERLLIYVHDVSQKTDAEGQGKIVRWARETLPVILSCRRAAVDYCRSVATLLPAEQQSAMQQAASAFEETVQQGRALRTTLENMPTDDVERPIDSPPNQSWLTVLDYLRAMQTADMRAAEHLAVVAGR